MAVNVGSILVSLGLDSAEFKTGLSHAEKDFKRTTRSIEASGKKLQSVGRNLSLAVTAPLVAFGISATKAATESREAIAQVETRLASMGMVAGRTSEQLQASAKKMQSLSTIDDDDILRNVTANLLTFGKVSGDVFDRAQTAIIDLSVGFGQDLKSSAVQVGKALQDPVKGLSALTRVGVTFTAAQKAQIEAMVKSGNIIGAQTTLLAALEGQFKGSAKASRDAAPGSDTIDAYREFSETVGEIILKVLPTLTSFLTKVLNAFNTLNPGIQSAIIGFAAFGAALGPILFVVGSITRLMGPFVARIGLARAAAAAAGVQVGGFRLALQVLRATLITTLAALAPYAIILGALAGAIYLAKSRTDAATKASAFYTNEQKKLAAIQAKTKTITEQLATATGKARAEILANAKALRQETLQYLANARAILASARAKATDASVKARVLEQTTTQEFNDAGMGLRGGSVASSQPSANDPSVARAEARARVARANSRVANQNVKNAEKIIREQEKIINSNAPASVADIGVGKPEKVKPGANDRAGPTGPTAAEIAERFRDMGYQLEQQALSARERLARNVDDRADLQLDILGNERDASLRDIAEDKDFSAAQKAALTKQTEALYGKAAVIDEQGNIIARGIPGLIAQQIRRDQQYEIEQQTAELADDEHQVKMDALELEAQFAETQADRKRIALAIFDAEEAFLISKLEAIQLSETANDFEKQRAKLAQESMAATSAGRRDGVGRSNETDWERYKRSLDMSAGQVNEAVDGIKMRGLDSLNDGLADAITGVKSLGSVFKNIADQIIADLLRIFVRKQIVGALSKLVDGIGGGGSGDGSSIIVPRGAKIPGNANGTSNWRGGMTWVGERGRELVNLPKGASVTANKDLRGMGGMIAQIVPSPYFNVIVDGRAQKAAAPMAVQAATAGSNMAQGSLYARQRRTLP